MAPNKRYSHNLKVPLSHCEMAALTYLQQATGQSLADHVRQAIFVYARQHPSFDPSAFAQAAMADVASEVGDPDLRSFFDAQLRAFTRDVTASAGREPSLMLTLEEFRGSQVFSGDEDE